VSPSELTTHTVDAGGFQLQVDEAGSGLPALVFVHYWGGSARTWSSVIQGIAGTVRCVAYDQRGWGRSGGPAEGYAISDLATDLATVVSALGLDDYVLVGHSMGGKSGPSGSRRTSRRTGRRGRSRRHDRCSADMADERDR
jgi:pimeloyl-ACP methyl ester carboxylesterase